MMANFCRCQGKATFESGKRVELWECECPWPEPENVAPPEISCTEWVDALETALRCTTYYREYVTQDDDVSKYHRAETTLKKAIATERSRASTVFISETPENPK